MAVEEPDKAPKTFLVVAGLAESLENFRGPLFRALCEAGVDVHAAAPSLSTNLLVLSRLRQMGVTCHEAPQFCGAFAAKARSRKGAL